MIIVDSSWVYADPRGLWGPRLPARTRTAGPSMPTSGSGSSFAVRPAPHAGRIGARGGAGCAGLEAYSCRTISTEISTAGIGPRFSSQCVVFLSSGQPTPGP